jgi:lipopolysaccharide assembly outer membrane protein LptD (OstA)
MFFLLTILALGSFALLSARADETPMPDLEIDPLSEKTTLVNDFQTHTWAGSNGVIIKQGSSILIANEVHLDENTREVTADGMVTLQTDKVYWTGEHLEYNFRTRELGARSYRAGVGNSLFVAGDSVSGNGNSTNKVLEANSALITTDDTSHPGYYVRAKSVKIEDAKDGKSKEVTAREATLYVDGIPVFYLPVYRREIGTHSTYFVVTPGYRSRFGPYLLTEYHVNLHEGFDAGLRMDYREKRGPGVGPMVSYDLDKIGKGEFEYYFTHDWDAKNDPGYTGFSEDRQRLRFSHIATLQTNFVAKASVNYQSDPLLLHDLFEAEYRTNTQPKTVFEVNKLWSNFSLDAVAQPQVNRFFPTVERLPDIKLSGLRQQLGVSPFFYETESSFAYLRNQSGIPGGTNYAAMRADTYHQIILPHTFFGFLNVTPRAGGRLTHYSETETDSPIPELPDRDRFVFNTGMEASFKASRLYSGVRNDLLDVTDLRHIVEPSVNYVYVPRPNVRPGEIPQFDTEVPSLRLLPIDFPDYNSIDSIDSQNVLRLGVRNTLQTKRDGNVDTLLNWQVVTDWRLDPHPDQYTFSDIYSDLDFKPRRWLVFNSETRYDIQHGEFNLARHTVTMTPNDRWSISLGHWYFRGDPTFGLTNGNNIIYTRMYFRLNENWGTQISHHFEARDGTMEEQFYTIYRDFRSFTGALTFRVRDQRIGPADYTIAFTMQLKSHPQRAGRDHLEPTFLLGN